MLSKRSFSSLRSASLRSDSVFAINSTWFARRLNLTWLSARLSFWSADNICIFGFANLFDSRLPINFSINLPARRDFYGVSSEVWGKLAKMGQACVRKFRLTVFNLLFKGFLVRKFPEITFIVFQLKESNCLVNRKRYLSKIFEIALFKAFLYLVSLKGDSLYTLFWRCHLKFNYDFIIWAHKWARQPANAQK